MRCCLTASRPSSIIFASRQTGGATIPSLPARRQHRHTRSSSLANPNQLLTRLKTMFKGKSAGQARAEEVPVGQLSVLTPRQYQQDLINLGSSTNVLITLPTGAGKTLIAAEIIRIKLPTLKAAGQVAVFLAPTNPLADQHHLVLKTLRTKDSQGRSHGPLKSAAFHGDTGSVSIGTWSAERWKNELREKDVIVMTPELLLHCLSHASFKLSQIGILVFDEAHHCASDHPYAQFMEDFYHTAELRDRQQIVGLTASPVGVEGLAGKKKKKSKGKGDAGCGIEYGLQGRMNARLLTLAEHHRPELKQTTPVPENEFVDFDQDAAWVNNLQLQQASSELEAVKNCMAQAKKCSTTLQQLRSQAGLAESGVLTSSHPDLPCFAGKTGPSYGSIPALAKQMNGMKYCMEALGPWGAAAAAHLDLLSAVPDSAGQGAEEELVHVPEEGEGDDDEAAAGASTGAYVDDGLAGMSDMELAKLMQEDDLGKDAGALIEELRAQSHAVLQYLQDLSTSRPGILPSTDVSNSLRVSRSQGATSSNSSSSSLQDMPTQQLAVVVPQLLALLAKSSLLLVMSLLTELLVADKPLGQAILTSSELHAAAASPVQRSEGALQRFSEQLLQQVPFQVLQAQIWPNLPARALWPSSMPPLLSSKVRRLARLLADRQQQADAQLTQAGKEDRWAAIVFVETKLTALVLHKLIKSCPDMCKRLRTSYLVGNTEAGGGTAELGMSHSRQRETVGMFRRGEVNVLICTNIGSEGMDFRQCQMVVAYDPPSHVTQYIQARGRARSPGSTYAWLRPSNFCPESAKMVDKQQQLIQEAAILEAHAATLSASTRQMLQAHSGAAALLRTTVEPHNPAHLQTSEGGLATMRLAQVLLAGYCARLPGNDRFFIPQAWYKTSGGKGFFQTTIYLPPDASQHSVVNGSYHSNLKSAKNAAALEAIHQLHREGRMTGSLFPSWGSNHLAKQLAAEPIPTFSYSKRLQAPLAPRTLNLQQQQMVTLHMHCFQYSKQQHEQGSSGSSGVLYLAVGAPLRCKAIPGNAAAAPAFAGSSSGSRSSFGVLTWQPLPGAIGRDDAAAADNSSSSDSVASLQFPAWLSAEEQEPSTVSVTYEGAVSLTATELLALMHYQNTLNNTINWSNKRLLGLKRASGGADALEPISNDLQAQFGGAFKPLNPTAFNSRAGLTAAAAAAALVRSSDSSSDASAALQGAEICYMFAPIQQQQQGSGIDWNAMSKGLVPAAALLSQQQQQQQQSEASTTAAAAMTAVPATVTTTAVTSAVLQDCILLAGHSSQLYRCKAVAVDVTPLTPMSFEWTESAPANSSSGGLLPKRIKRTASNHTEYYSGRYGVQGLRGDLPMLEVSQAGRQKALQLVDNPLKPPQLQPGAKKIGAGNRPVDLNAVEAAAAAVDFESLLRRSSDAAAAAGDEEDSLLEGRYKMHRGVGYEQLYLPLELCWVLPLRAAAWRELQLLPAFMYRINSMLRLQQVQQQLSKLAPVTSSSSALLPQAQLLMAAVTVPGAREVFDMEGLEYLGDAVLKMLTTNYLLQVNPTSVNEGELSVAKATIIRNVALARKALEPSLSLQQHLHLLPYHSDLYSPTGHLPATNSSSGGGKTGPIGLFLRDRTASSVPIESEAFEVEIRGKRLADCVEALIGAVYLSAAAKADSAEAEAAAGGGSWGVSSISGVMPVSEAGLAAAAAFCEAAGVLPTGSAALACKPCLDAFSVGSSSNSHQQQQSELQRLQQQVLGHTFSHPALLQQALTHVSRFGGCNYQRLEFLGDSVLDLYVSSWLMLQLGQALQQEGSGSVTQVYPPAELTWRRAALVNNINLARAAAAAQLQHHMAASSRQLTRVIKRFVAAQQPQDPSAATAAGQGGYGGGMGRSLGGVVAAARSAAAAAGPSSRGLHWGEEDYQVWHKVWVMNSFDEEDEQTAAQTAGPQDGVDDLHSTAADGSGGAGGGDAVAKLYAPKALADIVESLVGAVLVDSSRSSSRGERFNWAAAWQVVQRLLPPLRT